ncbi:hypothetical protein BJF79_22270 [Actinomadura sp. CNU-125]|uniref:hypothetical protein n=1 Tax=Actinomadura sp. CNU-125 TaxID=1904961 RepID=UPI00095DB80A|nr:hypothetical protein [Actinomadura sp. CNU-125]OLT12463.1 hypothetical protein BJF79_22270 [Actinomadura sp. CNU-125]
MSQSLDRKRWAQKAQQLKFTQLDTARKQAEGWRTGLGGLTALLSAVLIVKGRDNITALTPAFRWGVAILLGAALLMLVIATLLAVRAASGRPGENFEIRGETLRAWTMAEVRRISTSIRWAARLATLAIVCVAAAVGCTWLGPEEKPSTPLMDVQHDSGRTCGELLGIDARNLVVKEKSAAAPRVIPAGTVVTMHRVTNCK